MCNREKEPTFFLLTRNILIATGLKCCLWIHLIHKKRITVVLRGFLSPWKELGTMGTYRGVSWDKYLKHKLLGQNMGLTHLSLTWYVVLLPPMKSNNLPPAHSPKEGKQTSSSTSSHTGSVPAYIPRSSRLPRVPRTLNFRSKSIALTSISPSLLSAILT